MAYRSGGIPDIVANLTAELPSTSREISPAKDSVAGDALYFAALAAAVASWFFAIRIPLWLDETVSYWQISGGLGRIWARQGLSFPAYSFILWLATKLFGTGELALRLPSVFAMLAAAVVLYRIAREFFSSDAALAAVALFCIHPAVVFAAIDARPYAFGVLAVNCAILFLLRWTRERSGGYAVAFGIACAVIFYFHYLFGVILPAFALVLLVMRKREWRLLVPQAGRALIAFALMMLPVVPRLLHMFRTTQSHVFAAPPRWSELAATFAPGDLLMIFGLVLLIAAASHRISVPEAEPRAAGAACLLLAMTPIGILFAVSALTPVHVFVERYRLVAVPGVALCWGLLLSRVRSHTLRLAFTAAVVTLAVLHYQREPAHGYTWKYALQAADAATLADRAPLLICSDLPEADHQPMPADPLDSGLFAPLSYYRVHAPVVPLPRAWNAAARSAVQSFLHASPAPRRFVALAFVPSWQTLREIADAARQTHSPRLLGTYNGVMVMEFDPRP
jgi:hypothetical protein